MFVILLEFISNTIVEGKNEILVLINENNNSLIICLGSIKQNYDYFSSIRDVLELIRSFSYTWFSLDNFDKGKFPIIGSKKSIKINAKELMQDIAILKAELIAKKEATAIFATEKNQGALEGILGNVFQSVFGEDAYSSLEKKAANLLYFIVKNHPFNDGNKRSGAFAFIWFLQKAKFEFQSKINPQTLAILTILIAESNPKEKDKIIGLILTLLKN
jgi:death-on-curing family protein